MAPKKRSLNGDRSGALESTPRRTVYLQFPASPLRLKWFGGGVGQKRKGKTVRHGAKDIITAKPTQGTLGTSNLHPSTDKKTCFGRLFECVCAFTASPNQTCDERRCSFLYKSGTNVCSPSSRPFSS